jgi:hypothetical protein
LRCFNVYNEAMVVVKQQRMCSGACHMLHAVWATAIACRAQHRGAGQVLQQQLAWYTAFSIVTQVLGSACTQLCELVLQMLTAVGAVPPVQPLAAFLQAFLQAAFCAELPSTAAAVSSRLVPMTSTTTPAAKHGLVHTKLAVSTPHRHCPRR